MRETVVSSQPALRQNMASTIAEDPQHVPSHEPESAIFRFRL